GHRLTTGPDEQGPRETISRGPFSFVGAVGDPCRTRRLLKTSRGTGRGLGRRCPSSPGPPVDEVAPVGPGRFAGLLSPRAPSDPPTRGEWPRPRVAPQRWKSTARAAERGWWSCATNSAKIRSCKSARRDVAAAESRAETSGSPPCSRPSGRFQQSL